MPREDLASIVEWSNRAQSRRGSRPDGFDPVLGNWQPAGFWSLLSWFESRHRNLPFRPVRTGESEASRSAAGGGRIPGIDAGRDLTQSATRVVAAWMLPVKRLEW